MRHDRPGSAIRPLPGLLRAHTVAVNAAGAAGEYVTMRSKRVTGATRPGPVLLIVEDHVLLATTIAEYLGEELPGCRCRVCAAGEEAVRTARTIAIDAILMDVSLPGINGIEATRQIHAFAPSIPIVILTSHDRRAYEPLARAVGASDYIVKDAICHELVPVLSGLLRTRTRATPA